MTTRTPLTRTGFATLALGWVVSAQAADDGPVAGLEAETYRPQFHFTARKNWLNDPNGLVYYRSEYHMFFQHNPTGIKWGNMTWGHAVSPDMFHWKQLPNAIEPNALGTIFSGSAVVDVHNTAGFQTGVEKVLVAFYTSAGSFAPGKPPFTQSMAYSNDRGRTWSDVPDSDGRRLQILWMRGGQFPDMPLNRQMSFPCAVTLRTFPEGIRLCRRPIREIERIHGRQHHGSDTALPPGANILSAVTGALFDIRAEIKLGPAKAVGFTVRGVSVIYDVKTSTLSCLGTSAPLAAIAGGITLRILVDRTSVEVFANDGRIAMSYSLPLAPDNQRLELFARNGAAKLKSLDVWKLRSIWRE